MVDAVQTRTRMTRQQFMALPETNLPTELIHGELIVSPAPKHPHQRVVFRAAKVVEQSGSGGEVVIAPMDVHFSDEDIPQPDVFWVSGAGSLCRLEADGYWHGAPDLVIEVLSPSTAAQDRGAKFPLYQRHGVREYWLIDPDARFIEVYRLLGGAFARLELFEPGQVFTSSVLHDAAVDVSAILG